MSPMAASKAAGWNGEGTSAHPKDPWLFLWQPEQTVRGKAKPRVRLKTCSSNCALKPAQATGAAPKPVTFWVFPFAPAAVGTVSLSGWTLGVTLCCSYRGCGNRGGFESLFSMQSLRRDLGERLRARTAVTLGQCSRAGESLQLWHKCQSGWN